MNKKVHSKIVTTLLMLEKIFCDIESLDLRYNRNHDKPEVWMRWLQKELDDINVEELDFKIIENKIEISKIIFSKNKSKFPYVVELHTNRLPTMYANIKGIRMKHNS